jgi:hypothetical protein|tara:strand:+ start:4524 stop:4673 length:150 start_codon:yes stop_codon:yes gene_type:complete
MNYELNEKQLNNLFTFLSRVDLKGSEVTAFNELLEAFNTNKDSEKKEKK